VHFPSKVFSFENMSQFIQVAEDAGDEPIEIPSEDDGTLLATTLEAQFPGACGLKYKAETGAYRGIRLADGVLYPPDGLWGNHKYIVVFPKSRYSILVSIFVEEILLTGSMDRI
jgi:hypothetical protein